MNRPSPIQELQKRAPKGVLITTDPAALPSLPGCPEWRIPLRRDSDDRVELVLLAQLTTHRDEVILSVPDVLGINGETQIELSRANRVMQAGQTSLPTATEPAKCNLCGRPPQKKCDACGSVIEMKCDTCGCVLQPLPRQGGRPAVADDNIRPFGPLVHKVVSSQKHIVSLKDLGEDVVRDATEQFYEIAEQGCEASAGSLDGLNVGMNFGEYARSGASQIHFHYQVAGLGRANYNAGDRLGALCQAYRKAHSGADYLGDYERALRQAGLVIAEDGEDENKLALAYAPISPRFKGEVQIMLCRKDAGNILDTTPEERRALSDLQHRILLRFYRLGCQALNQVWYMTRFSAAKNDWGQRLIISLYPRTSIIAFYELSGNNVIDSLPWNAAQTLKAAEHLHFSL